LKKYIDQHKPFLLFLGKFLVSYLILTFIYQTYLNQFDSAKMELDGFTKSVASQTETVLTWFNNQSYAMPHLKQSSIKIFYHNKYVSRIIEGCNALSVIILFASFIIAFSGKFKPTLVFILLGSVIIHVLNIARIALLSIAMFHYPAYEELLHGVVFPLFIYGVVFLLWVIWVNNYSFYATENPKK
jgi:exosortase family protein XrtF